MYSSVDTIWVLLGAALVFFMQPGFMVLEVGLTRAKNAGNIIMKNTMDFCLGTLVYWIVGFGIMFGANALSGLVGSPDFFITGDYSGTYPSWAYVMFQTAFCGTAATIVSGAMAERTKFSAYCVYSMIISAFIYPVSGHWIWGGGWLSELGFHDFAGSTAVHMVGGVAALIGAMTLGPRIGKYDKNGKARAIPGHNLTFSALGVFILWFAWFGFNGCSTVSATGDDTLISMGSIFINTNMAAAVGGLSAMMYTWFRYGKPDVSMTLNGILAGLVGVTAGCDAVSLTGAFFIGLICGIVVAVAVTFIDSKLKIDDPVGAVSVHGVCGALGTLLVGLFSTSEGLFYGHGIHAFLIQLLGVVCVIAWVAVTMTIVFQIIKHTMGLRVSAEEEIMGLDITEHDLHSAYEGMTTYDDTPVENVSEKTIKAIKLAKKEIESESSTAGGKMTNVSIIANKKNFGPLKKALEAVDIQGMTITDVVGCGVQKGGRAYYRGAEVESTLLPKIKIDIVVGKVPVQDVVDAARQALYTGGAGDGKIFITDVENVVRVSTGEQGIDALQYVDHSEGEKK
ncbi:MAG: ammonium transporter [Anaerovoracaceae bacterium]|nr:ammonium transporter [Bacillota bacterium]MDY2670003.1 ammonium transporter [Anaerovoracaceae bacterium]